MFFRQGSARVVVGWGLGCGIFLWEWLAFLLWFCINRHSATNKWNWCHVRSGRVALWGRKREPEKEACVFAFCSGADGASVIHMHEAGGCQPITLTLVIGLWPWASIEKNGTSQSCGVKALAHGWEKWLSLVTPVLQSVEECRSALKHLPGHMQFMLVNDGCRGRRNEKMSQRHFCIWGRCLGKEHGFHGGGWWV